MNTSNNKDAFELSPEELAQLGNVRALKAVLLQHDLLLSQPRLESALAAGRCAHATARSSVDLGWTAGLARPLLSPRG